MPTDIVAIAAGATRIYWHRTGGLAAFAKANERISVVWLAMCCFFSWFVRRAAAARGNAGGG